MIINRLRINKANFGNYEYSYNQSYEPHSECIKYQAKYFSLSRTSGTFQDITKL